MQLYRDMFPNQVDEDATTDQQAEQLADFLSSKNIIISIGGFVIFGIYLINLVLTARVIGARCLVSTNYTLLNNVLWILGVVTFGIGVAFAAIQGSFATEERLPELIASVGAIAAIAGLLGTIGAFKKNRLLCTLNVMVLFLLLAVMIAAVVIAFQRNDQIQRQIKDMSTEEKREIGEDLGFATLSDKQLEEELEQALRRTGMSFAVSILLVLMLLVSGIFYLKYAKEWKDRVEQDENTAEVDDGNRRGSNASTTTNDKHKT